VAEGRRRLEADRDADHRAAPGPACGRACRGAQRFLCRALSRRPGLRLRDHQEGRRLFGATNGGKPVEIKAELADVLFTPGAPRSRKIFERDAKGSVTGFLSRREERDVVFEREQ